MPLTVGGGVRSIEDIRNLLLAGADKVSINTAAVEKPGLIQEAAKKFAVKLYAHLSKDDGCRPRKTRASYRLVFK